MIDIEKVKKLREATGAGFKDCNLIKETINNAKSSIQSSEPKQENLKESKDDIRNKTIQEIDREKLEKKFSDEDKGKLN